VFLRLRHTAGAALKDGIKKSLMSRAQRVVPPVDTHQAPQTVVAGGTTQPAPGRGPPPNSAAEETNTTNPNDNPNRKTSGSARTRWGLPPQTPRG
jgi:hypothetical protein